MRIIYKSEIENRGRRGRRGGEEGDEGDEREKGIGKGRKYIPG
jgi:hypothetical protein